MICATNSGGSGTAIEGKMADFRLPRRQFPEKIMMSQFLASLHVVRSEWRFGRMQRWLMAAVIFAAAGSAARADYFIIKVNLASTKDKKQEDPNSKLTEQAGGSGLMPGAGALGTPGFGNPGVPGGGAFGARGGMGGKGVGGGGMTGPGGLGGGDAGGPGQLGGTMGAGALGQRGGPGAGAFGQRGGLGAGGLGQRGSAGFGIQGGLGMRGGPGMGAGALGGMASGMKGPAGSNNIMNQMLGDDEDKDSNPLFIGAIIEARHEDVKLLSSGRYKVKHKWGETRLFIDNNDKEIEIVHVPIYTVAQQYAKEKTRLKGVDLALWALAHGLYDEVPKIMAELAQSEPKNPAVQVFQKVEAALAKEPKADDPSLKWRDKLGDFKDERSKHYVLCYDGHRPNQVQQRLARLENNLRGFYYWFALHGKALPMPEKRLVAVLIDDKDSFISKHKEIFDDDELVADGFFDRHENIAVYSAYRLDPAYEALDKITGPMWKRMNANASDLLKGKSAPGLAANENAYAQTLTLLQKAMQDESELNSVSYEGTRQLLDAVGFMPKGIELPKWIDFGLASYFEVAKGAFWPGTGSQNQAYVAQFQIWNENKKLDKPADALLGVVTDKYFRRVAEAKNKENSENKARTLAWSLIYFLAQKKLDGLVNYCAELRQLPRDLQLNEGVLALAFARGFGLCEAGNPDKIDQNKFNTLANEWFAFSNHTVLEVAEVKNLQRKNQPSKSKPGEAGDRSSDPGSYIP
jgi:hypothetical protein